MVGAGGGTSRQTRSDGRAQASSTSGIEERAPASMLRKGDLVVCEADDVIPSDGEIVEGVASVDESAMTGESAPVIASRRGPVSR